MISILVQFQISQIRLNLSANIVKIAELSQILYHLLEKFIFYAVVMGWKAEAKDGGLETLKGYDT
jgi:hypothetical protein